MTTSSSWNFSLTAAQLIARAARNLGIVGSGGTVASADETDLLQTLNVIVKEFQGTSDMSPGIKVWTRQRITLILAEGQQTYTIGPATTDSRASLLMGRTTLDGAEAIGQTTWSVTATTDSTTYPGTSITMTASDFIGLEQDDGTVFWTTVSSISAGDTVTVAASNTVAAAVGNYVWWFTTRAQRFPVIESAVIRDEDYKDTPIGIYRDPREYDEGVVDKYADGKPTTILVEPLALNTRIILNSQPTDVTDMIVMTALYPAEDYDATTNDLAFPQEWYGFLEWELTLRACPMYQKKWTPEMDLNYKTARNRAINLNPEVSNAYFQSNADGSY